ncbi:hypothetical protein ASG43_03400 [Aureimonas sp. Leaf454]|uniref:terminase large subunit domain-containing protein n=1 Tax=Aureimonas sp. Leaf454 TaxID=1736381 RepID=UPI0006FB0DE6|nr:terminase family protein [Aureimonas sp. Leaf454]KQT54646.1 hypothetical protein ASG43_03400 [Aureimonas sp. Leaf454]
MDLSGLDREAKERLALLLAEREKRYLQRKFHRMFPDEDTIQADGSLIHAREKYVRHMEFFATGLTYRERCFMAANRIGKTVGGSFETTCHLTGLYPHWWIGRRFDQPVRAWAAGKTNESTRDVVQKELLGDVVPAGKGRKGFSGTGMIPGRLIEAVTWKQGVQDFADVVKIKHASGGLSSLGMKSFQQGRGSFEGTAQHLIWLDEECPIDVYGECLIRTATTGGIVMLTFTPLEGLSETVLQFMPQDMRPE